MSNGFDDVLSKPIDQSKFYKVLSKHLPKRSKTSTREAIKDSNIEKTPKFQELLNRFVCSLPDSLDKIVTYFEQANWDELAKIAHILKGRGGSFGYSEITEIAARLERAAKVSDRDTAKAITSEIKEKIGDILFENPHFANT